ncbi:MAG: PilZ domain-containing protein [Candidatus Omnitrophota bacterium]
MRVKIFSRKKEEEKPQERRKYKRIAIDAYVKATLLLGDISQDRILLSKDINPGGVFLLTDDPMPVGTLLNLKIQTPTSTGFINAQARVVRIARSSDAKSIGMGLAFTRIEDKDKEELMKHLYLGYHYTNRNIRLRKA